MNHSIKKEDFFVGIFTNDRDFTTVKIFFDGSCGPENKSGNNMGYGWYIEGDGEPVAEGWGYTLSEHDSKSSNNKAEWRAVQCGLRLFDELNISCESLKILGDSNMVVSQMNRLWAIKEFGVYRDVALETMDKYKYLIKKASIRHIYRDKNKICDELSNRYIEYLNKNGFNLKVRGVKPKKDSQKKREQARRKEIKKKERVIYLDTIINFGKYKDQNMTLGEIKSLYPEYVKWLIENTTLDIKLEDEKSKKPSNIQTKPNRKLA